MSKKKVKDVFELQMGKTPSRSNREYWDGGEYDWVSIRDLGTFDKFVGKTTEAITEKALSESKIKPVPPNTLIMSFKLSIGKTAITTSTTYTNEAIMAFLDKGLHPINLDYFYHQFTGRDWTAGTNKAVMGATLNKKTLGEMLIHVPNIDEQREIARILDQLDLDIRMERQRISKLDQLVKSRFVEMFGAASPGDCNCTIGDYCKVISGFAFKSSKFRTNGVPIVRIGNIADGDVKIDDTVCYPQTFLSENPQFAIFAGDVLMAMSGATTGKAGVFGRTEQALLNQRVACLRAKEGVSLSSFIRVATRLDWMQDVIMKASAGCAQPNISAKQIALLPMPDASLDIQQRFDYFVTQVDKSQFAVRQSIKQLELLKAKLMQEYFS